MVEQKLKMAVNHIPEGSNFLGICETDGGITLNGTLSAWAEIEVIGEFLGKLSLLKVNEPDLEFPESFIHDLMEFLFNII